MPAQKRKIGGYLPGHPKTKLDDRLRLFKEAGFEFVALTIPGILAMDERSVTPRLAEKYGLFIDNVHLTGTATNQLWRDCLEAEDVLDRYCREIRICAEMGVKTGITHVTWGSHAPIPEITSLGIERFKRIAECAEKNGFCLALENSVTSEHLVTVLDAVDSPSIGFCFDSGHWACFTPEFDFIDRYGDRMVTMHIDDNDGIEDIHLLPYDGVADWDRIKRDLAKTKAYESKVVMEVNAFISRKYPGKSAAEIRALWENVPIADDARLVDFYDGYVEVYQKIGFDEYVARMAQAARRVAED